MVNQKNTTSSTKIDKVSIIMGSISVVVVFIILLFRKYFSEEVAIYVRILFSLGIAGLSAGLLGTISITKNINGIKATGGFAVLVMVYFFNPVGFGIEYFDMTVMLKNKGNEAINKFKGSFTLYIGNDKRTKKIGEDGTIEFKQIPYTFFNKIADIEIQSVGWQFKNGSDYSKIRLNQDSAMVNIQHDNSLCCITGTVSDENGNYLDGVTIMVDGVVSETNKLGFFQINIPPDKQREEQRVIAAKKGFKSFDDSVYPSTKAPMNISLKRK